MKTRTPIRQGDILIIPIANRELPKQLVPVDRDRRGRIIIAEGETTGHCHAILDDPVTLFRQDDLDEMADRFLLVEQEQGVDLVHEEHDTVRIPAGAHVIRHKREYQPAELPRAVAD